MASASAHIDPVNPIASIFAWVAWIVEIFGAILLTSFSDDIRVWSAWLVVMLGGFINYMVHRKQFHQSLREWHKKKEK